MKCLQTTASKQLENCFFTQYSFANLKEWASAQTISCGRVHTGTVKCSFTVMFLGHCTFLSPSPPIWVIKLLRDPVPTKPVEPPSRADPFSSSWLLVSRTSSCWSTRGAEGCQWREESSHQMQPSPARERRHLKVSGVWEDGPNKKLSESVRKAILKK